MLPTALALAAAEPFSAMLGGHMRFVVDSAPDGWPKSLVPAAPARTVGGVSYAAGNIVLFDMPSGREQAMNGFSSLLTKAGWRPAAAEPRMGRQDSTSRLFCADTAFLSVTPRESTPGHTTLNVTRFSTRSGMFSPICDHRDHTLRIPIGAGVSLPPLRGPGGSEGVNQSTTLSIGETSFSSWVKSTLTADSLLTHYARQLAAAGWQLGGRQAHQGLAIQRLEQTYDAQRWMGTLSVASFDDEYFIAIQIRKSPASSP
jgi:hypothetical protein